MPSFSAAAMRSRRASAAVIVPVGLAGTRDHHAFERRPAVFGNQQFGGERPARGLRGFEQHRPAAQRAEDVAVRRVTRQREGDAVPGLEQRKKCQHKSSR